jgi:phospholipid/cholesterol/gamma-HCH transport system substrate-binding protein
MKAMADRDPFRIGLLAIAGVAVGAIVVVVLSVVSFGTSTYTAVLEHTAGLRAGEDVQVAGVSVGTVKSVELADDDVVVTFTVDHDITLGSRTTASVKVATLLGTHYLEVDPHGSGSLAGGRIPLERTSVPYNLQDVMEQGTSKLEELDPVVLAKALTAVSNTLERSGDDVGPALQGVARLSELVSRRSDQTGDLLRAAREVTEQLDADSGDILGLMRQTNLVVTEVTARREAIHRLLVETRTLADALTAIITQTRADLKPALSDLDSALASLRAQDRSLQHVLEVMAPAVRYVANATGNGPYLDLYLKGPALPADDSRCALGDCK